MIRGISSAPEIGGVEDVMATQSLAESFRAADIIDQATWARAELAATQAPDVCNFGMTSLPVNATFALGWLRRVIKERRASRLTLAEIQARNFLDLNTRANINET